MIRLLCLYPLSLVFSIIVLIRNNLYDWKILPQIDSKIPVISVGNIQVGGTGKTPFVAGLIKLLLEKNLTPLIITRGYKRNTKKQIILNDLNQYTVEEVGDEPYYLKVLFNTVPIIIDSNKTNAIITANTIQNIDCIVLDDGYQSRYIKRDLDIVLINTWQETQKFNILPFGTLREKVVNLNRADFLYTLKGNKSKKIFLNHKTHHLNISYQLITYKHKKVHLIDSIIKEDNQKIIALSGIANPEHFIESLNRLNINYDKTINLKNHFQYNRSNKLIIDNKNIIYITTYKDYFKLNLKKSTVYILDIKINIDDILLMNTIKKKLNESKKM